MRKLIAFILVAILGIGIGLSINPSNPNVEEEYNCVVGKNYQEHCVKVIVDNQTNLVNAKDKLDVTKYPSYIIDEEGYFLQFDVLGQRFKEKYFGVLEEHVYDDYYFVDFIKDNVTSFKFVLEGDYNPNDIYARMIILIQEFENYGYYYVSNGLIQVEVVWFDSLNLVHKIKIGTTTSSLLDVDFSVDYNTFIDGDLGSLIRLEAVTINIVEVETFYNDYITNLTYDGYVLDYK